MYKISVPVTCKAWARNKPDDILKALKELNAERVFVTPEPYQTNTQKRKKDFAEIKRSVEFFKSHGLEVGAWYWAFWTGPDNDYAHMTGVLGDVDENFSCPSDPNFRAFAKEYIKEVADLGVDMIMFDDDFRYGFLKNGMIGCVCKHHIAKMEELLGEKVTDEIIKEKLISGEKNKYRTAWLDTNKFFLELFAKDMRDALNETHPDTRLGFCSCLTSWDFDGSDPYEIAKIMAGDTRPFIRLSAAPYWAGKRSWGCRMADVIELSRMESKWLNKGDIEIFSEGDVYPRPRWNIPANYLEALDTALRADDSTEGMIKYAIDYSSSANYERGYIENHLKNSELYKDIEKHFASKDALGVRVYEFTHKAYDMTVNDAVSGMYEASHTLFSGAAKMLSASSVPTVYEGEGLTAIAFGENARHIDLKAIKNGLIIDSEGARILMEKGIDVGIKSFEGTVFVPDEYFPGQNEYANLIDEPCGGKSSEVRIATIDENAEILSFYVREDGSKFPASYIYENKDGMKFLVFLFDANFVPDSFLRQYTRRRSLFYAIEKISGNILPAKIDSNPDMYVLTKEKDGELTVGIWNFSFDTAFSPEVILGKEYETIEFFSSSGDLSGNKVTLSDIPPFGFSGFTIR